MKAQQLARSKRIALSWLLGAAAVFIAASAAQHSQLFAHWPLILGLVKMVSEAALIGGLADWFAVSALFKPIPSQRYSIPHTNIVAANKPVIARNLAAFVQEKFFNKIALTRLIRHSQPTQAFTTWLNNPAHARQLANFLGDSARGATSLFHDKRVNSLLAGSLRTILLRIDLTSVASGTLQSLTRAGRHQQLLDQLIKQFAHLLQRPGTQQYIAYKLYWWLKNEHRTLEKILPSQWLSEQGALAATQSLSSTIDDIAADPDHPVRKRFDDYVNELVERIDEDPALQAKLDDMRQSLLENQTLHQYVGQLVEDMQRFVIDDLAQPDSRIRGHLLVMVQDMAGVLQQRPELQRAMNIYITQAARYLAPQLSDFLTRHIRTTIEQWDDREMAEQIELNIGKDLQKVRINGTLVGGLIGGVLFFVEYGIDRVFG